VEWNPKKRVGGLYPKERVGQPKPVTNSIQKHGLHTTDKKEWAVLTKFFFEGLWDFISVFVEDDKCKERVGGRGMNERDENRDERRDSEERNGTNR
jgi:hypothetical protein